MSKTIIDFLSDLSANNNKSWFDANRLRYENARNELFTLVEQVIAGLNPLDPSIGNPDPKKCVFRQHRDVRFSKDKSPFKTNMGAFIVKGGKNSQNAGYYIHFEPGQSFVGGGIYAPMPDILLAVRKEIYYHAPQFKEIIYNPAFKAGFGELMNEKLVNVPKTFPADFADADLLKYKHYAVGRPFQPEMMSLADIHEFVMETFTLMIPFNHFLNEALINRESH